MKRNRRFAEIAFTRLELLAVLATLALFAGVALPVLANTKARSQRLTCFANLRQIGHALQVWGNEHANRTPWRTDVSEGGTFHSSTPLRNNAWFQFAWMSNELGTPKILVCPADQNVGNSRVIASNWSTSDFRGGYATIGFRDRASSYTIGLDAFFDQPRSILSGDRNVQTDGINSSCSSQVGNAFFFASTLGFLSAWTNSIHSEAGNVLFYDGQVEQLSIPGFRKALNAPYRDIDNGFLHLLIPN
jgi:prepilin-type processing-associated H-X9-DG protein